MKARCIDATPRGEFGKIKQHINMVALNRVDLTVNSVYNIVEVCDCGDHYCVNPDDAGDRAWYCRERFEELTEVTVESLLQWNKKVFHPVGTPIKFFL